MPRKEKMQGEKGRRSQKCQDGGVRRKEDTHEQEACRLYHHSPLSPQLPHRTGSGHVCSWLGTPVLVPET